MNNFKLLLSINILIILIYTFWISKAIPYQSSNASNKDIELGRLGVAAVCVIAHALLNLGFGVIISTIKKENYTKSFLLCAGMILVIGYSACYTLSI